MLVQTIELRWFELRKLADKVEVVFELAFLEDIIVFDGTESVFSLQDLFIVEVFQKGHEGSSIKIIGDSSSIVTFSS